MNLNYLFHYTHSHIYWKWIDSIHTRGVLHNINAEQYSQMPVPLPLLKEQQKIASILSKVDELIQKTDQIIEQIQRLKKGLIQKLLTNGIGHSKFRKTELGEIPDEWRIVKMRDVVNSYRNGIYKRSSFYGHGVINTGETPLLDVSKEELLDYGLIPDDILINRVNSAELVGKAGILNQDIGPAVFDSMIIRVRVNDQCIPQFLNYFLNSKIYFRQIEGKIKHAIGQSSLNQDDLNNILIGLPTVKEQTKIVWNLSILDRSIQHFINLNKNYKYLKQGLMQKLLTGKLRVKV